MQAVWVIHCDDVDIVSVATSLEVAKATIAQTFCNVVGVTIEYKQRRPHLIDVNVNTGAFVQTYRITNLAVHSQADHL